MSNSSSSKLGAAILDCGDMSLKTSKEFDSGPWRLVWVIIFSKFSPASKSQSFINHWIINHSFWKLSDRYACRAHVSFPLCFQLSQFRSFETIMNVVIFSFPSLTLSLWSIVGWMVSGNQTCSSTALAQSISISTLLKIYQHPPLLVGISTVISLKN